MGNWIICPQRDGSKVSVQICVKKCELKSDCDSFKKIPRETLIEVSKKLGLPIAHLKEIEPVINVEAEPIEEPPEKEEPVIEVQAEPVKEEENEDTDIKHPIVERPSTLPSNGKAQRLYQQALILRGKIGVMWFELGEVLGEMFVAKCYMGHPTWHAFLSEFLEPLDRQWRSGDYLRTTVAKCKEVGISKEVAGQIGWTKLKETVPVLTKENKDKWLKEAQKKGMTTQKLNAKVRVAQGKITEEESKVLPEKMFFSVFREQKEIVELAIEVACRVGASESKGYALADVICPSFLAEYPEGYEIPSKPEVISKLLGRFGTAFGVRFEGEVIDNETGEILVGSRG